MMSRERVRELRQVAAAAREKGKLDKAIEAYVELEKLDAEDPAWAQRAAECHRQLGQQKQQLAALERAAHGYAERGFTLKAVALSKMILALDPTHTATQDRLAELQAERVRGVDELRASALPQGKFEPSPRSIRRGAALDALSLRDAVPGSVRSPIGASSGVYEIPIAEIEYVEARSIDPASVLHSAPLFQSVAPETLKRLIERLDLVERHRGETVFERGDAVGGLHVLAEGRVVLYADEERRVEIMRLEPGAVLGVVGVLCEQPRQYTAVALDECRLLELSRLALADLVEREPEMLNALLGQARKRLVNSLTSTHPMFLQLAPEEREEVASKFRFLEAPAGAELLTATWISPGLFVILTGRAAVYLGDGDQKKELGTLESGAIFGEASLLTNLPASTSVVCQTKCFVLVLPSDDFKKLAMADPRLLAFLSEYSERRREELEAVLDGLGDFSEGRVTLS